MAQGWGLQGCWTCAVAFQVIRLILNSARLLRRRSVLSQTTPLSDAPTPALAAELAGDSDSSSASGGEGSGNNEPPAAASAA